MNLCSPAGRRPFFHLTSLFVLLLLSAALPAQPQQRFKAGLIAGVTASQIDGDESAGYHKLGLQAGLRGVAILREKQQASVEILYTQRGCRNQPKYFPEFNTTLDYIEVPVQWHYCDWLVEGESESDNYYKIQINLGLSYARLLNYRDKFNNGFGIFSALPYLNENSFCAMAGASFYASRHVGFTFRWQRAVNKLYQPGGQGNYRSSLNEHLLTFQTVYMF